MRLLVTGALGYLGSKLADELDRRGHETIRIDRPHGDLSEPGVFDEYLEEHLPLDRVIHLAATPGREFCERDPEMAMRQNTFMTKLVAETCGARHTRTPLCFVSTSEVYGATMDMARYVNEDDPLRPRNVYAWTKMRAERACEVYAPDDLIILRPSMPYSGDQATGFGRAALPTMVEQALSGEEIVVHRGTSRSWTYVTDVIDGMATAIEEGEGTYNCGDEDTQRTMDELVTLIIAATGSKSEIRYEDPPSTVSRHKRLSSARLRALGWRPRVSLMDGIAMTRDELLRSRARA